MARVNGRGSIANRGKGVWTVRVSLGDDPVTGKQVRPSKTVYGTKKDAEHVLDDWIHEINFGIKVDAADTTFSKYADTWLDGRRRTKTVRPRTLDFDARMVKSVDDYIGNVPVPDVDAATLRSMYSAMSDAGKTPDALHKVHIVLNQIMKSAMNDDLILRNPCDKVHVRAPKKSDVRKSLTLDEATRLSRVLDAAGDTDSRIVGVRIGLATGMRIGEVMGLTWENVDLDAGMIRVCQQYSGKYGETEPKTPDSIREVAIDAGTVRHLKAWKTNQAVQLVRFWKDTSDFWKKRDRLPVVNDERCGFHSEENYRRWFQRFCANNGFGTFTDDDGNVIPPRTNHNGTDAQGRKYSRMNPKSGERHYSGLCFHELRHTQGTLLIANGEDVKTVQHRLGHASAATTMDMYVHADPANDRRAADLMGSLLGDGREAVGDR